MIHCLSIVIITVPHTLAHNNNKSQWLGSGKEIEKKNNNNNTNFFLTYRTARLSLTCLVNLISVNQTLGRVLIGCELHLLPVEEAEEGGGGQGGLVGGVASVELLDLSPPGGRTRRSLHPL